VAVNELTSFRQHFPLITPFRKYFYRILFKASKYEPNKNNHQESSIMLNLFNAKYLRPSNTDIEKGASRGGESFGISF
jgi:hypothetical protein